MAPYEGVVVMNKLLILLLLAGGSARADRIPASEAQHYMGCKQNIKNLATACEMYGADHAGHYPKTLAELVTGHYLPTLPACPSTGSDTYSGSYWLKGEHYFFSCKGPNHKGAHSNPDRPAYDSVTGLIEGNH